MKNDYYDEFEDYNNDYEENDYYSDNNESNQYDNIYEDDDEIDNYLNLYNEDYSPFESEKKDKNNAKKNLIEKMNQNNYKNFEEKEKLEKELFLILLEFPTFLELLFKIEEKLENKDLDTKSIVRRYAQHAPVLGYFIEDHKIKAGDKTMHQALNLLFNLKELEFYYDSNKYLYEIINKYKKENESNSNFTREFNEYKEKMYEILKKCDLSLKLIEEITEKVIQEYLDIQQAKKKEENKFRELNIHDPNFISYFEIKKSGGSWKDFAEDLNCSIETSQYIYDSFDSLLRIKKYYNKKYPFSEIAGEDKIKTIRSYEKKIKKIKNQILSDNLAYAKNRARIFIGRKNWLSLEDIEQEASKGLIDSIDKYDYKNESCAAFTTFATSWIHQHIQQSLENSQKNILSVPFYITQMDGKINGFIAEYKKTHCGQEPTNKEIAKYLTRSLGKVVTPNKVLEVIQASGKNISLSAYNDNDENQGNLDEIKLLGQEDDITHKNMEIKNSNELITNLLEDLYKSFCYPNSFHFNEKENEKLIQNKLQEDGSIKKETISNIYEKKAILIESICRSIIFEGEDKKKVAEKYNMSTQGCGDYYKVGKDRIIKIVLSDPKYKDLKESFLVMIEMKNKEKENKKNKKLQHNKEEENFSPSM